MIPIEIDQLDADAIENGSHIDVPLREDVIPVLHEPAVLDIGSGFPAETFGTFEKNDSPVTEGQFSGNGHAGEASADDDSGRSSHGMLDSAYFTMPVSS
jgi:hypothetical protein